MIQHTLFLALFWLSLVILVYTFLGYPFLIWCLARIFPHPAAKAAPPIYPTVSIVLIAHNEEARIVTRIENLFGSIYPSDKLEIIIVSDGSTDATTAKITALHDQRIHLMARSERSGKASGLNSGLAAARGEIIIFADARQRFAPEAIRELVHNFSDPKVGAVSGNHTMDASVSNIGGGVDTYWRLEKMLRHGEARVDSSVGCTGAIYAIRRALYREIPPDTILDDVVIPMQIATQNYRVIFDPAAFCFDPQPSEPARERLRKRRTLAGNFQMLFRNPRWLLPWKNRIWWQLISHKYLRIAAPFFMLLLVLANGALIDQPVYKFIFFGQCAFYGMALLGFIFSSIKTPLLSVPAGFVFLNFMTVGGFWNYLRGSYRGGRW